MVAPIPGKPCQGVEAVEQKDAEGQTWDQSLQQHPTLNPCRLNPHIWAGRMTPKRGPPSPRGCPQAQCSAGSPEPTSASGMGSSITPCASRGVFWANSDAKTKFSHEKRLLLGAAPWEPTVLELAPNATISKLFPSLD